jgi:L-ribulokinase
VEQFRSQGVAIETVIALGGIPQRSEFAMQTAADVLAMPIRVVAAEQACALGAAMLASVAAGLSPDVGRAQKKMGGGFRRTYRPDPARARLYDGLYAKYKALGAALEQPLRGM